MKKILILTILSTSAFAQNLSYEGSFGGQARILDRKENSLDRFETPTSYSLIHGTTGIKYSTEAYNFESSLFYRRAQSELYETNNLTKENIFFPRFLVSREAVDLNKNKSTSGYRSDFLLHKFTFKKEFSNVRAEIGRIFINYGLGETFNPINPFNLPNGLFVINDLTQASDGLKLSYFYNDQVDFVFYGLSNRDQNLASGENHPTLFAQVNIRKEGNQLSFVAGSDEQRGKIGSEISIQYLEYLAFAQVFYQTSHDQQNSLVDGVLGIDRQWTSTYHTRIEFSYQELETKTGLSSRFLPQEYTIALANEYEAHPLLKLKPILTIDPESLVAYAIFKANLNLYQNLDLEGFVMGNLNENKDKETLRQKLLTRDAGIRFQYYF